MPAARSSRALGQAAAAQRSRPTTHPPARFRRSNTRHS